MLVLFIICEILAVLSFIWFLIKKIVKLAFCSGVFSVVLLLVLVAMIVI